MPDPVSIVFGALRLVIEVVRQPLLYLWRRLRPPPLSIHTGEDERFCQERSEWSGSNRFVAVRRRLGIVNTSHSPITVSAIVETIEDRVYERPLQVSHAAAGTAVVTVPTGPGPMVFVDLVDHFPHNQYAWVLFAQNTHEDMLPRRAQIVIRLQSDHGEQGRARLSVWTHLEGGIPTRVAVEALPPR